MSDAALLAALEPYAGSAFNIPGRFDSQAAVNLIRYYQRQYDAAVGGLNLSDADIAYGIRATGDWHVATFDYPGAYNHGRFDQSSNLAYVAANSILSALVLTEQTLDGTAGPKRRKFQELTKADVQAGNVTSAVIADRIKAQQGAIWRAANPDLGSTGFGAVIGDLLSNPVVQVGLALAMPGISDALGAGALTGEATVAGDFGSSEILAASGAATSDFVPAVAGDFGSSEIFAASGAATSDFVPAVAGDFGSSEILAASGAATSDFVPAVAGDFGSSEIFAASGAATSDFVPAVAGDFGSSEILAASSAAPDASLPNLAYVDSGYSGYTPQPVGGSSVDGFFDDWGVVDAPKQVDLSYWSSDPGNDPFATTEQVNAGWAPSGGYPGSSYGQASLPSSLNDILGKASQIIRGVGSAASALTGAVRQSANVQNRTQQPTGIASMNIGLPLLALASWMLLKG